MLIGSRYPTQLLYDQLHIHKLKGFTHRILHTMYEIAHELYPEGLSSFKYDSYYLRQTVM